jgi:Mg2+ and Co2+ transporter CorA
MNWILIGGLMVLCMGLFYWLFWGDEWSDL